MMSSMLDVLMFDKHKSFRLLWKEVNNGAVSLSVPDIKLSYMD